jgi:hypothetical protein
MNQLWDPWIGKNFNQKNNRLLLIGESHYTTFQDGTFDEQCYLDFLSDRGSTINVIEDLLKGKTHKFYENTYRLFFGEQKFEKLKFWENVAFYNLVQKPMKTGKERPTMQDFKDSMTLLLILLHNFQTLPTHILFLGSSSQKHFKGSIANHDSCKILDHSTEKIGRFNASYFKISFKNHPIDIFFIKHPSSYFSWKNWRSYLKGKINKLDALYD